MATREIKFRAWDGKQMLNRELFDRNWYNADEKQVGPALPEDKHVYQVMQYTGLKDKNGVEIYEGDIVKSNIGSRGDTTTKEVKLVLDHYNGTFFLYPSINSTTEVIGNIYENKDLL